MAIFLNEEEVVRLLPISEAIECLEEVFSQQGQGAVRNYPRNRTQAGGMGVTMMVAVLGGSGFGGFKVMGGGYRSSMVTLYGEDPPKMLAMMESRELGQIRTGAATGLATKYMSREDSRTVGIVGTGHQAISQLTAVCAVRPIEKVKAFSRNPERRQAFCSEMSAMLGIEVMPVESAQDAVVGTDVVIAITNVQTLEPVILGDWLEPGMHINAAGANSLTRRELDNSAVTKSSVIVTDAIDQAKIECADLVIPIDAGLLQWEGITELGQVVAGHTHGRGAPDDITLFESQGIGMEDVAVAAHIFAKATQEGTGITLPF